MWDCATVASKLIPQQLMDLLEGAPEQLSVAAKGLTAAQLSTPPAPEEWSANAVLAHLRACADVWGTSIATILDEDNPTIRAVNPRSWIESTDYVQQEFGPSLRIFTKQRRALMNRLRPLASGAWNREATITGAGRPLQRSVLSYAERMARHERPHLKQVRRAAEAVRGSKDLTELLRWEAAGGTSQVLRRKGETVEISLRTCGGDEELGRIRSSEPALLAYLAGGR